MKEKMIRVRIDKDLFNKFKKTCNNSNTNMSKEILNFINYYVDNNQEPAFISRDELKKILIK